MIGNELEGESNKDRKWHFDNVHEKIKCEQCVYAQSGSVAKHKMFVCEMGDRNYKCEQCPCPKVLHI